MEEKHIILIAVIAFLVFITFSTTDLLNCVNDEGEVEIENSISLKIAIILAVISAISFLGIFINTDVTVSFYLCSMILMLSWGLSVIVANGLVKVIIFVSTSI